MSKAARQLRRAAARAGREQAPLRARRKKRILLGAGALLLLALSVALLLWWRGAGGGEVVSGHITEFGDVELVYAKQQWETISPACGCEMEQKSEEWRGVTFLARDFTISRSGEFPYTSYMIMSPMPGQIDWTPEVFPVPIAAYALSIPYDRDFDPVLLVTNPDAYPHRKRLDLPPDLFYVLLTEQALHARLLGEVPIGAWIPTSASTLRLGTTQSVFASDRGAAVIEESYAPADYGIPEDAKPESDGNYHISEPAEYPIGDFIGRAVFWSEGSSARLLAYNQTLSPESLPEGKKMIALVVDPPFATRVTAQPLRKQNVEGMLATVGAGNEAGVWYGARDKGTISLQIHRPAEQAEEFDGIYARLEKNDRTEGSVVAMPQWRKARSKGGFFAEGGRMTFRFPPLPPNRGFNVFGHVKHLRFTRASGKVRIKDRVLPIEIPSDLVFSDISALHVEGGAIEVPVRVDRSRNTADVLFNATARVSLNGEAVTSMSDRLRRHFDWTNAVVTFVSAVAGIFGLWLTWLSLRRGDG